MTARRIIAAIAAGVVFGLAVDVAMAWLAEQFENRLFDG